MICGQYLTTTLCPCKATIIHRPESGPKSTPTDISYRISPLVLASILQKHAHRLEKSSPRPTPSHLLEQNPTYWPPVTSTDTSSPASSTLVTPSTLAIDGVGCTHEEIRVKSTGKSRKDALRWRKCIVLFIVTNQSLYVPEILFHTLDDLFLSQCDGLLSSGDRLSLTKRLALLYDGSYLGLAQC